ncbi:MAG TPA: hypothetical protein VFU73_11975 [Actinocrinis sp.]|nr:hypothetical protein [Actinocrinis sp.]
MGVTTTATRAVSGAVPTSGDERTGRSTPVRLGLWTGVVGLCLAALLAVSVGSLTVARDETSGVSDAAAVASDSSDLYFALADLDAQAARLVLLGNGSAPPGSTVTDFGSSQLAALNSYNQRTAQVDADLHSLAARVSSSDDAAVARLASGVTEYHQIADAAIALDQTAAPQGADQAAAAQTPTTSPTQGAPQTPTIQQSFGAPAGRAAAAAIGYYSRATTLMQGDLLPSAKQLRDDKAAALSDAASSADRAGIVGAAATIVTGLGALVAVVWTHRRMTRWFRRSVNPGLALTSVLVAALTLAAGVALLATAGDGSTAGGRFTDYLAVTHARTDSYDADGAATRYLLMPDDGKAALNKAVALAGSDLAGLGPDPDALLATQRWRQVSGGDLAGIVRSADSGDFAASLARDTGTARGQEAFDFYFYDSALVSLSDTRLASFQQAMSAARSDLAGWTWLPWVLVGCALGGLALGVRPRLAEYR